jgi:RND family efflux transporter MFP subunit
VSDRLVVSLALVPMVAGLGLVAVLQRPGARGNAGAFHDDPRGALSAQAAALPGVPTSGKGYLGVVSATQMAELAADGDGRVGQVFVRAGEPVRKGAALLQIDRAEVVTSVGAAGAELAARASDVSRAEARLDAARKKHERLLAGGAWLSAQEIEAASSEVRVAEAELRAARSASDVGAARLQRERLRAERHTLSAPFDGVVVSVDTDPGDSVAAGRVLVRLASTEREVRFAVPRESLDELEKSGVALEIPGRMERVGTSLRSLRPEVDTAAQLVFASAVLPSGPAEAILLPGTVVRVHAATLRDDTELPRGQP